MTGNGIKERARLYVGKHPPLFFGYYSARRGGGDPLVNGATEVVIEGFPRSGNTFAVFAFEHAQRREVRMAHHLHAPAQVIRAARRGIPALVLLREPMDAATSLMLRDPSFSAERALRYYVSFYETIADYQHAFVLGLFEEITEDYGAVIERLNARFGTEFTPFDHTEENVDQVFRLIEESHKAKRGNRVVEEQIARPSTTKSALKAQLKERLYSPELEPLTARADAVYMALLAFEAQ